MVQIDYHAAELAFFRLHFRPLHWLHQQNMIFEHSIAGVSTPTHQQLASAQDEACICIANAAGKLAKCTRIAGVGVGAKQYFACRGRQDTGLPASQGHAQASSHPARCTQTQLLLDARDLAKAAADAAEAATSSSCTDRLQDCFVQALTPCCRGGQR